MEIIIAIATVVIAGCAIVSYRLAKSMEKRDKEYRQQTSDLYQAMVITYMMHGLEGASAFSTLENKIREFQMKYKGKTPIF